MVDQAYFEYIDRPDYPDAVERYLKAGRRVAVLRTFSKIYGLAGLRVGYAVAPRGRLRGDGEGAPAVRPDDTGAGGGDREHRRRRRDRAAARGQRRGPRAPRVDCCASTGSTPVPPVGNFLYVETGGDANDALRAAAARRGDRAAARRLRRRRRRSASRSARPTSSTVLAAALARVLRADLDAPERRAGESSLSRRSRGARARRQLPPALPRDARLRARHVDGDDRAHGRRHDRTHSPWWVSALFIVTFLPSVIVGLAAGPLVDRLSRKELIVAADLVRLGVFARCRSSARRAAIVVLAAVAGIANSFFRPAVLAGRAEPGRRATTSRAARRSCRRPTGRRRRSGRSSAA